MKNQNIGMQILYQNALAGSIANSDVIFRSIERDYDVIHETLSTFPSYESLRAKDREQIIEVANLLTQIDAIIRSKISTKTKNLTNLTSEYLKDSTKDNLTDLLSCIEMFKEDLETLDESVSYILSVAESTIDTVVSMKAKLSLTQLVANLENLLTHATQLFIILFTTEGSAQQCKMTY